MSNLQAQFGVVVCRNTGLTNEAHVEFSRLFGELDDIRPYIDAYVFLCTQRCLPQVLMMVSGRKSRLPLPELFDAGNIDPDTGDVAPLSAAQVIGNKVSKPVRFHSHKANSFRGIRMLASQASHSD